MTRTRGETAPVLTIDRLGDIASLVCARTGCGGLVIGSTGLCDPCYREWLHWPPPMGDEARLRAFTATPKEQK